MAEIEALRAKAMASMTTSSAPSHRPNPEQTIKAPLNTREDGEISSSSEGASISHYSQDHLALNFALPINTVKKVDIHTVKKQSEIPKTGNAISVNPQSKLVSGQSRPPRNHHKQIKHFPYKRQSLTWSSPSSLDDNLVISFSDDESESEPERDQTKRDTSKVERSKIPTRTTSLPAYILETTSDVKTTSHNGKYAKSSFAFQRNLQATKSATEAASVKKELKAKRLGSGLKLSAKTSDNKPVCSCQETLVEGTELYQQKGLTQRKRINSLVNQSTTGPSSLNVNIDLASVGKHPVSDIERQEVKRLKVADHSQSKDNLYDPESSHSMLNPVVDTKRKKLENSVHYQDINMSGYRCSKNVSSGQINVRNYLHDHEINKTIPTSSTVLVEELMSSFVPVVPTVQNKCSYVERDSCTNVADISSNDDLLTQYPNRTSNAEDAADCSNNPRPPNLESIPKTSSHCPSKSTSFLELEDVDVESLLKLEELLDKELEEAQELRRKCELEEMQALKAYRKLQRDLMYANDRCSRSYRMRQLFSAQFHDLLVDLSSTIWSNKPQVSNLNKNVSNTEDLLVRYATLNRGHNLDFVGCDSNVRPGELVCHNSSHQPTDLHEMKSVQYFKADAQASDQECTGDRMLTISQHNMATATKQKMDAFRFLSEINKGKKVPVVAESKISATARDIELEATLRSKLFARFGQNVLPEGINGNVQAPSNDYQNVAALVELETSDVHNQMLPLSRKLLVTGENDNPSGHEMVAVSTSPLSIAYGQYPTLTRSFSQTNINFIPEKKIHPPNELHSTTLASICSLPCSIMGILSKHVKFLFLHTNILTENPLDCHGIALTSEDCSGKSECMLLKSYVDSSTSHLAIDPFWPFCLFELRGKCNDEECQWQHFRDLNHENQKHISSGKFDDASRSSYLHRKNMVQIPAYWIGSNHIKSETVTSSLLLGRSNWQFWQSNFCAYFRLPFPIARHLPLDAPALHDDISHVDSNDNSKISSLYIQSQDITRKHIFHSSVDSEQYLELAINLLSEKNKVLAKKKALSVLSRSLEASPDSVAVWSVFLHIFYRKEKDIGKDDMFLEAVRHNKGSYGIWLMYINSRMQLNDRIKAYSDAISSLCQTSQTRNTDNFLSSCILDIFLQMVDFLCMSGNVELAISIVLGSLNPSTSEGSDYTMPREILTCLMVSDRCIFCICCLYVTLYRRLPKVIVQKHELTKDLPLDIEWPCIQLTGDKKQKAHELMEVTLGTLELQVNDISHGKASHFLAINHIRFYMAVEDLNGSSFLFDKYMKQYPTCTELVMLYANFLRHLKNEPAFEVFEHTLRNWPNTFSGIQRLWNQYAVYILDCKAFDFLKEMMAHWFHCFCEVKVSESQDDMKSCPSSSADLLLLLLEDNVSCHDQEDTIFGLLNLFLYAILHNDTGSALLAINEALRHAGPDYFSHCARENAAFLLQCSTVPFSLRRALGLLTSYQGDVRYSTFLQPLSRKIFSNVRRPRVRQLINNFVGPVSRDCTLLNLILEDCYGPSLLPEKFDDPKDLVDFAEPLMELSPANYVFAISVCRIANSFSSSGITLESFLYWANSFLANSILQAYPVAPEEIWIEAASLLGASDEAISEKFISQGLLVYPFSVKLWQSYYNLSKIIGNTSFVVESARLNGVELDLAL